MSPTLSIHASGLLTLPLGRGDHILGSTLEVVEVVLHGNTVLSHEGRASVFVDRGSPFVSTMPFHDSHSRDAVDLRTLWEQW